MRFPFLQPAAANGPFGRNACLLSAAAIVAGSLAWYGPTHVRAASPSMPTNVRLSPGNVTYDGMVVITWDAPTDANVAYYQIFRYNGSSAAKASEVTYIGRTEDARNYFIDQTPTEGNFQYAVISVDKSANASMPSAWVKVTADFPSNGIGKIEPDVTAPPAPGGLHAGIVGGNSKTVSLGWNQGTAGDLWRCIVYRQDNSGTPQPAGYTAGANNSFTDTVPTDGNYNYSVVAQDKTGNVSPPTAVAGITVDSTAPSVNVSTPVAGQTYDR
ncbi:MAG: hypothetical protein JWN15_2514, partial [Firmicutes bacterium]|nr:hypothetical protein [Bacillota bacterium]